MADIQRIAQLANVSTTTVSQVLSGHSRVNKKLKKRVLSIIEQENLLTENTAAAEIKARSDAIGYLEFGSPQWADVRIAESAEKTFLAAGYKTFVCRTDGDAQRSDYYLNEMISSGVAGVVLCPQSYGARATEAAKQLQHAGIPTLILNNPSSTTAIHSKRYQGWGVGLDHLQTLGHKNVLLLADEAEALPKDNELPEWQEGTIERQVLTGSIQQSVEQMKVSKTPHTAIFCENEVLATATSMALRAAEILVPEQMSVISFATTDFAQMLSPPLTTVRLPVDNAGTRGAEQLLEQIHCKQITEQTSYFSYELHHGASTAAPNQRHGVAALKNS